MPTTYYIGKGIGGGGGLALEIFVPKPSLFYDKRAAVVVEKGLFETATGRRAEFRDTLNGKLACSVLGNELGEAATFALDQTFLSGSATASHAGTQLTDTAATFLADGVKAGYGLRNMDDGSRATVLSVDSETQITHTALAGGTNNDWGVGDRWLIANTGQVIGEVRTNIDQTSLTLTPQRMTFNGAATAAHPGTQLTDAAATFLTWGIAVGYELRNTTDGSKAVVISVDSETQITHADLLGGTENDWDIGDDWLIVTSGSEALALERVVNQASAVLFLDGLYDAIGKPVLTDIDRDYYAEQGTSRPVMPWIVISTAVVHYSQLRDTSGVWQLQDGEAFLVSSDFVQEPGESLTAANAKPSYVGLLEADPTGGSRLRFRAPEPDETVISTASKAAEGLVEMVTDTPPNEGDTVTMGDGERTLVFRFTTNVTAPGVGVPVLIAATIAANAVNLAAAINATANFDITATVVATSKVRLVNDAVGVQGNQAVTESTLGVRLIAHSMIGGEDTAQTVFKWDGELKLWVEYRTMPQRAFDAMSVFERFDPDGIYGYVAKSVGLMNRQLIYDNARIRQFRDPERCPTQFLSYLIAMFGASALSTSENPEVKREVMRRFLPLVKVKGTPSSIESAIAALGYIGRASHVWAKPKPQAEVTGVADAGGSSTLLVDAAGDFLNRGVKPGFDATNVTDGSGPATVTAVTAVTVTTTALTGGGSNDWATGDVYSLVTTEPDWITRPFNYPDDAGAYQEADLNDQATAISGLATAAHVGTQLVDAGATFLASGVGVGYTVRNTTDGARATVISVDSEIQLTHTALVGGAENDWDVGDVWVVDNTGTHLARQDPDVFGDPTQYHPTGFIVVHVNETAGVPLFISSALADKIVAFLAANALPAHVRVKAIATDVDVNETHNIELTDSVLVTDVLLLGGPDESNQVEVAAETATAAITADRIIVADMAVAATTAVVGMNGEKVIVSTMVVQADSAIINEVFQ